MKRVDVVSAIVYDERGNLLIVENVKDDSTYWSLPGGAVEAGETLHEAVIREVKEETGLDVEVGELSSLREVFFTKKGHHVLFVTFHAKVVGGEVGINDPDHDIVDVQWVDAKTAEERLESLFDELKLNTNVDETPAFYAFEGNR